VPVWDQISHNLLRHCKDIVRARLLNSNSGTTPGSRDQLQTSYYLSMVAIITQLHRLTFWASHVLVSLPAVNAATGHDTNKDVQEQYRNILAAILSHGGVTTACHQRGAGPFKSNSPPIKIAFLSS
jgi:hypothetical protein